MTEPDWRTLPRKKAKEYRDRRISVRVTENEFYAIHERVTRAGCSLCDYIVAKALGRPIGKRVKTMKRGRKPKKKL